MVSISAQNLSQTPITATHAGDSLIANPGEGSDNDKANQKRRYRLVVASIIWCFIVMGLNDGSLGPLLPIYQEYYNINFITVSVLFICGCSGCITAAVLNVFVSRLFALSKILVLGTAFQVVAHSILSSAPPFYAMCIAFFLNGMGAALLNAQGNSLLSMLHDPTSMGLAHASYGFGALIGPLISTQFANIYTTTGFKRWALYYTVMLGTVLSSMIVFIVVFRGKGYEEILHDIGVPAFKPEGIEMTNTNEQNRSSLDGGHSGDEGGESEAVSRRARESDSFASVLKQSAVHTLAAFIFIYVGLEVTIGGWIVTFMINERGGGASSGYVSSGFFAGLALGRVTLLWVNKKLGERNAVFLYIAIGIGLEFTVWFVPSLIGNAIAVSFVGLVLGPFYPIVMSQTGRIIPRKVLSGSIGWIAGFGQSGSAILPFATGALANRYGIISLQPLIVAMMAGMAVLWFMVPSSTKKKD